MLGGPLISHESVLPSCLSLLPELHSHCHHDWPGMPISACQWSPPWHQNPSEVPQTSPASLHMVVKPHTRLMIIFLQIQDVLEEATNSTFRELEAYANAQHAGHTNSAFGRHRLVPTALAVAGSMNAADHAGTFSALVSFLRAKVMLCLTRLPCCTS